MHSSTQQFVRAMDAKDIKHSDPETAAGGRETVTVIYSGEYSLHPHALFLRPGLPGCGHPGI